MNSVCFFVFWFVERHFPNRKPHASYYQTPCNGGPLFLLFSVMEQGMKGTIATLIVGYPRVGMIWRGFSFSISAKGLLVGDFLHGWRKSWGGGQVPTHPV